MYKRKRRRRFRTARSHARRRSNLVPMPDIVCGDLFVTSNGGRTWTKSKTYSYSASMTGRLYREGFGLADESHPGPPFKTGGPFHKFTFYDPLELTAVSSYVTWTSASIGYRYDGGFVPNAKPSSFVASFTSANLADETNDGDSAISGLGNIDTYGATGWNRFRPGNPTADLGVFLGELRDVPRMLSGTAKFFHNLWRSMGGSLSAFAPKSVADAWLNTQFGWRPFISDLRKFYRTYTKLDEHLQRIIKNNGKWQRRGGTVLSESDTTEVFRNDLGSGHYPVLPTYFYQTGQGSGSQVLYVQSARRVWFEGAFRYWIPDIGSVAWRNRAIVELFGAMPCPSLIWNLIPWSWLVDWCSNLGDVISNMSTGYADNLAAKYAYIMGHTQKTGVLDSTCKLKSGTLHGTWTYPVEWKSRSAASPFGFGLSSEDFSARQLSILAALGISRLGLR